MPAPFRAIIVGGGPIGLVAAHMLSRSHIDFILLEKQDTLFADRGASIGVYPQTFRVLDQLGLLDSLREIWSPLKDKCFVTHGGKVYREHPRFSWMEENHGHPFAMFHRAELLRVLYECFPEEEKKHVLTNKRLVNVTTQPGRVTVQCDDGSIESGSMVIAADGAHSVVRSCMRRLAGASSPHAPLNKVKPYVTKYRLLYGTASLMPGMPAGSSWDAHGVGMSTQLFVGRDKAWFFWYEPLESTTQERVTYTREDEKRFVKKWGHVHITDKIVLTDLYSARYSSGMTILEEGIVEHWSWDRIVLVGDAVVKTTTNLGFGFNGGIQGLVTLMKGLNRLVRKQRGGDSIAGDFDLVFQEYAAKSIPLSARFVAVSSRALRESTWSTWKHWLMDRYVKGAIDADRKMYHKIGSLISQGLVLEFWGERNLPPGRMAWLHFPDQAACIGDVS
ncbi:uncharacterized protein BCR38DRAFT_461326 [Pseudomassariella vexata]|uniref:FAD-binding domain-containing protein n=1 Tax=Pseudomassariella vexata TaxID=1141098 RepID=A0A1Y2DD88_9PEZI|nr:uncharacterized protein BCR38DRAFT_461326 [Pseudomassariella vexata]ORY57167.1 hypothetical protein BCR38DRAFT_461326 [Pseudomassariella vexata]